MAVLETAGLGVNNLDVTRHCLYGILHFPLLCGALFASMNRSAWGNAPLLPYQKPSLFII